MKRFISVRNEGFCYNTASLSGRFPIVFSKVFLKQIGVKKVMRNVFPKRERASGEPQKETGIFMSGAEGYYYEEALRYFQEAYQKQMQNDIPGAIELYQKSIELHPTAEAHTFLGWAYSFQGRFDEAIAECRKAIQQDPEFGNPYNDIGSYLIEQGRLDEAVEWLEKATQAKRYESYCYPYYNLGRVWEQRGDWFRAAHYYQQALKENADYKLAQKALGRVQGMMN